MHAYNPSTSEAETGGSGVPGAQLHSNFETRKQLKSQVAQIRKQKQDDHKFKAYLDY